MIIDMHTHAGRPRRTGDVDRGVLATMNPAGVGGAVVSAIGDIPMIRRNKDTGRLEKFRDPSPGECLEAVQGYLTSFENAGMRIAREADLEAEHCLCSHEALMTAKRKKLTKE